VPQSLSTPRIGIFWFVPGANGHAEFVESSLPITEVPLVAGFKTLETGHVDYWPSVQRQRPTLLSAEYETYPRGRANFRDEDGKFLLLLDEKVSAADFVDIVIRAWALPREKLVVMHDSHYRSLRDVRPARPAEGRTR